MDFMSSCRRVLGFYVFVRFVPHRLLILADPFLFTKTNVSRRLSSSQTAADFSSLRAERDYDECGSRGLDRSGCKSNNRCCEGCEMKPSPPSCWLSCMNYCREDEVFWFCCCCPMTHEHAVTIDSVKCVHLLNDK
ncbi:hypothetical protein JOB18_019692 [Solea senegalensis]|uniref:Uncharacterized protein n=1 Tax=Solea senegalensis TaxID=28829 RepID=A0AAV6R990_SOLSE|nr:hypothetical protein JOB18_019692 [Solea senegalensis]